MSQPHPAVVERGRMRRRNSGIALGFALLLCLAGALWATNTLGSVGDEAAVELTPETGLPSIPDPEATPLPSESTAAPADATTTQAPAAPLTRFVAPSGNIVCVISDELARCDVAEKTWEAGTPPADCTQTFGAGVLVDAAGPRVTCDAESLVGGGGGTLEYGRDVTVGDFSCSSSEAGMRCAQASTGLGFSVSRRAYTFF